MTIDDDKISEKPVEVVLPDESSVTEIDISDKKTELKEPSVKIKETEEENQIDERELALQEMRAQYEAQKRFAEDQRRMAEAEREARKRAEEYAKYQAQNVGQARNEVMDSQLRVIMNAIDATEQAAATAERDYSEAMAAGDYALAAKAQRAIAQAESHLLQLSNGRSKLEEILSQTSEGSVYAPETPSFEPQIQRDPVEMFAERLTPKSAQWLRSHPEAANNVGRLTRAHADAVEDGITPESDEYFQFIESRMGYSRQPVSQMTRENTETADRYEQKPRENARKSLASAPVSSSTTSINPRSSSSTTTMQLSAAEVEMAILAEPELPREKAIESYARNKASLIKAGRLSA